MGHKKCACPVGVCAPNFASRVCAHCCACVCSRSCVARERQWDVEDGREGTGDRGGLCGSARSGSGHGRRERGRSAGVGCKNVRSSRRHTRSIGKHGCELHAVSWTLHHTRGTVGVPHVVCRRFVVAVGYNVRRECRRTYWLLQQRSAVWPGGAGVPRDGSCAAPLVARAARRAAVVWQTAVA